MLIRRAVRISGSTYRGPVAAAFTEGSPAPDHAALRALATLVGLPALEVVTALTSHR